MIANNGGHDGSVILANVQREQAEQENKNIGFDVLKEQYVDMIEAGIIDPVKVTRGALENAASIAAMILTTDTLITNRPEKNNASGQMMDDYYDY
jgi:chaperonin GroEL